MEHLCFKYERIPTNFIKCVVGIEDVDLHFNVEKDSIRLFKGHIYTLQAEDKQCMSIIEIPKYYFSKKRFERIYYILSFN